MGNLEDFIFLELSKLMSIIALKWGKGDPFPLQWSEPFHGFARRAYLGVLGAMAVNGRERWKQGRPGLVSQGHGVFPIKDVKLAYSDGDAKSITPFSDALQLGLTVAQTFVGRKF